MEENKENELGQDIASKIHPILLLKDVANKLVAIILVAMIVMACTYIGSNVLYEPQYETKATFVATVKNSASSVYSNLSAAQGAAKSFSKILSSDAMKKQVANELGIKSINGTINAKIVEETNLIELCVTAPTAKDSYRITSAILNNYEPMSEKVLSKVILDVLQYPTVPTQPTNPLSVVRPVSLSGFITLATLIALFCVLAYLRDTVKTPEDVELKLDTKSLGVIQHENKYKTIKSKLQRKKTSILVTNPTTGFNFVETFKKLRTRIDYAMRKKNYKVLMVSSVLEDEGKSTVAVNIALEMKKKYENVLLIDADMKKSAMHKILGYQDKTYLTLNDVLEGKTDIKDAMIKDEETGLNLLFAKNCGELSAELVNNGRFGEIISKAEKTMDVIVIDTPPMTASVDTESVAEIADAAVLIVRQDMAPVRIINDMIDVINDSHAELLGCVLNNYSAADIDDAFSYGQSSFGKYGYGKYGYGKYGYGYGSNAPDRGNHKKQNEGGM